MKPLKMAEAESSALRFVDQPWPFCAGNGTSSGSSDRTAVPRAVNSHTEPSRRVRFIVTPSDLDKFDVSANIFTTRLRHKALSKSPALLTERYDNDVDC